MNAKFADLFVAILVLTSVLPVRAAEPAKYTDGEYPEGVIDVKGTLYGTTGGGGGYGCEFEGGCGTLFSLDPLTGFEQVLYSFCSQKKCADGYFPSANLIDMKGSLYGTTESGGTSAACYGYTNDGCGTLFSFNPKSRSEKVLYSFCSQLVNGACADGSDPTSLINAKGILYGTTDTGGTGDNSPCPSCGTAFSFDASTGTETVLYSFCEQEGCPDGSNPYPALIDVKNTLYGATVGGGIYGCGNGQACGTVFSLDPKTGTETVLHSFGSGADGKYPEAGLIAGRGVLYGTTSAGGVTSCQPFGCGTVFSIDPKTGAEAVLYAFCSQANCTDGANPYSSLVDVAGTLYGTTLYGGNANAGCGDDGCGTVFSINPGTGAEKVLHAFCSQPNCTDGADPSSLIRVGNILYGTTEIGGSAGCNDGHGCGTVFSLDPVTGTEKVLYAFCPEGVCAKARTIGQTDHR
jgi:uncharacterized repeat protein (TIGR03803 family)